MPENDQIITIIIADDHKIFREGLKKMLKQNPEINLIGQAKNGEELMKLTRELKPDVIISDIKISGISGISVAQLIAKEFPQIGMIALSTSDEEHLIAGMLSAGVKGYLLKSADINEIVTAIKTVNRGETYYCQETSGKLAQMIRKVGYNPNKKIQKIEFSKQEKDIINLVCKEYSNKEIGDILNLSKRSIDGSKERIMEKMGARNSPGIVVYAIRNRLFDFSK